MKIKDMLTIVDPFNSSYRTYNLHIPIKNKWIKSIGYLKGIEKVSIEENYGIRVYRKSEFNWKEVEENLEYIFQKIEE